jgi:MYXO-CTERM domain-containing protein
MRLRSVLVLLLSLGELRDASAETLVPGPGTAGFSAATAAKADAYERQIHGLLAVPLGFGLEAFISDPGARKLVDAFIASGARDFKAQSGKHPYQIIDRYEEFGDLGMFGGVQAAGDAFRYMVLRDGKAAAAEVTAAREALLRALDGLHWMMEVTGKPGIVARGIRRVVPEAGEPPLPETPPATTPLFDRQGNPLPATKSPTWRLDASGKLPFLVWLDDCSKDQLDGYVFAIGVLHDALSGDAAIPRDRLDRLVADARALAARLMEKVEIAGKTVDPAIQDADGRLTTYHDLSAEEIAPGVVWHKPVNGFNGLLALGVMRTLYHITGDAAVGRYYYQELIGARGYLDIIETTLRVMYLGHQTNYSNVNMAFVAIYNVLRYETDPAIGKRLRSILEQQLYAPGVGGEARGLQQPFFDLIYVAFRSGGTGGAGAAARGDALLSLDELPAAPYWDREVINCDAGEIASLSCTGIDGTPLQIVSTGGGTAAAATTVPMRIRPPTNFMWRSDPRDLEGGGSTRLNPGGELHCAYWMGRLLQAASDGGANVSSVARPPLPASPADAGVDARAGDGRASNGGCGCGLAAGSARPTVAALLLAVILLGVAYRRQHRSHR